jgi:hypothetical protein
MQPHYYALRRFCPYQGVIQVVEIANARAYSLDGQHWQVRIQRRANRYDAWHEADDNEPTASADDLMEAINHNPGVPFPLEDRVELWLLNKETLLPLALVKTRRRLQDIDRVTDPVWHPFLISNNEFKSSTLEQANKNLHPRAHPVRAQDVLERLVNAAARPLPILQWFERQPDGSGIGHDGMRVTDELQGRRLPRTAFPEMLVAEAWPAAQDAALVEEYHAWHAPLLLAHQNLSPQTRAWLEAAACQHPDRVLNHYPMYPEVLDEEAMQVALVTGRLMQTAQP